MSSDLDKNGHEIPDPTPRAIPSGFRRPETLAEQIQRMVRTHVSVAAEQSGADNFEDADDFDTGDEEDDEPSTPYEMEFDPVLGREISADMIRSAPDHYRAEHFRHAEFDPELHAQAEHYFKTHVNRARGGPPEPTPPDPVADPPKKKENLPDP